MRLEICIQDGQEHHAQIFDRFGGRLFEFPGRTLLRVLLVIPWAIPTVVSAITWRLIYAPDFGVLNALLRQVGLVAAAGVVAALPPVAIGFLLQKNLISGLMAGGVKG